MDILKSCLAIRGRARVQKRRADTGQAGLINVWISKSRIADGGDQQTEDEANLRDGVEELCKAVKAADQNRQVAMCALAEERHFSLELQVRFIGHVWS
ncbi:unnamed protein product [Sphagnum troendelagicum]|uniref:Uncharacterized protein n=1 Tax=Sphagnum troendelagicum TaxID=128251 RepID=A0ABP0TFD8_9BRYO